MNAPLKWKLGLAFVLVFVAGALTGGFFGALHLRHAFLHSPDRGELGQRMRDHLRHELRLTADQEKQVAPIVDSTAAKLEAIRVETAQRVRTAMESSVEQMRPLLTPEQLKKLEELEHEHRRRSSHHGFAGPPP